MPPDDWPWPFLRIAHRGLPAHERENSLPGFVLAMERGADMVETDVRASADGLLVLSHDEAIALPSQPPLRIDHATLATLRDASAAASVDPPPLLDEALGLRHHGAALAFNLDIKAAGLAPRLIEALRAAGRGDGILLTGNAAPTFAAVRAAEPWVRAALTRSDRELPAPARALGRLPALVMGPSIAARLIEAARQAGGGALTLQHTLATRGVVGSCHDAGLRVLVWTVDDPARMRALHAAGVDGITTNRVDLLVSLHLA